MHVVVAGDIGGAERLLVDVGRHAAETGAEHAIALFTPNPRLRAYLANSGLPIFDRGPVHENAVAYLWRSLGPADVAWLAGRMLAWRADVAHMHTLGSHVLGVRAARRAKVRTLRTEHHYAHYRDPSASGFTRWALARTDSIVAISDFVRAELAREESGASERVRVVRNGVDEQAFAFAPPRGEPDAPLRFAMACRLEAWKGVGLAIAALAEIDGATLVVAGEGSERPKLEVEARRLGVADRVAFLGRREDVRAVLAGADFSINASEKEPLGLSVLESLSVGRPVVAFAEGGIPEIVTDGATGFLAAPRSASSLAIAMRRASEARGELPALGGAARAFVERECTVRVMAAGYRRAYQELTR